MVSIIFVIIVWLYVICGVIDQYLTLLTVLYLTYLTYLEVLYLLINFMLEVPVPYKFHEESEFYQFINIMPIGLS